MTDDQDCGCIDFIQWDAVFTGTSRKTGEVVDIAAIAAGDERGPCEDDLGPLMADLRALMVGEPVRVAGWDYCGPRRHLCQPCRERIVESRRRLDAMEAKEEGR